MISNCPNFPQIRVSTHTNFMLLSPNSLPIFNSRFPSSTFPFKSRPTFSFSETQFKIYINKSRISCFRKDNHQNSPKIESFDEFDNNTPKIESFDEVLVEFDNNTPKIGSLDNLDINKKKLRKGFVKRFKDLVNSVFKSLSKPWTVPWNAETILQVTLLWVMSFWFVGSWMIPFGAHVVGFSKESLTFRGQALFSFLTDVTEGFAGILILYRCLSRFRPLPDDWFKFSLKGNWLLDVLIGCLMFPLVNRVSQFNVDLLPVLPSTPVTLSSVEQSIMARDPIAMGLYTLVLVVCAPLWEEVVFRGFLLPSLTKYMPVWCSILLSSVAFASAHFNAQRMLPLIFLGVVMGLIYTRSRNLLPSMLLHSLWNGFVFLDLMK